MRKLILVTLILILPILAGCGSDTADTGKAGDGPALVTKPSGVRYLDLVVGNGTEVEDGMYVEFDYTVWTSNLEGLAQLSQFATSKGRPGAAFKGMVGRDLLPGLSDGVLGMKFGGSRRIHVPWELGFGDKGSMPRTNLVFEVEAIRDVDPEAAEEFVRQDKERREYYDTMPKPEFDSSLDSRPSAIDGDE